MVNARPEIDPAVTGKVTVNFSEVTWKDALDSVCQQGGCDWSLSEGEPKVLKVMARGARKGS